MIIKSTKIWHEEAFRPLKIEISGSKITRVLPYDALEEGEDYGDHMIIPGLIDIHSHGYMGLDSNHATKDWIEQWVSYLPHEGVTGVLATTSTVLETDMLKGMENIRQAIEKRPRGAAILGVYSEGPMISHKYRGAQDENYIVAPSVETVKKYEAACGGHLIYCCIAPEEDEELRATKYCASVGIRVAIGHSGASFERCAEARAAGAVSFVHTFNGMPPLHHREPGVVGAAMRFEDMYAEIIGDGVHVDFNVVNILARLKGKDKLILVTDSVQLKGLAPGEYHMPGRHVFLGEDSVGRLPSGAIAGGTSKMNVNLGNLIEKAGLPEATAINAASCNPLRMLGLNKSKGYIKEGYDADIAVLAPDYSVKQTYVLGEKMI